MRPRRRTVGRGLTLQRIAQVVPDLATFAVDDGFAYSIPGDVSGVTIGSLVRVPLGGRTVRGFVTAVHDRRPDRELRPIKARSGDLPVFDERLVQTARWAAAHYVAPLSVVLSGCTPPNLPRGSTAAPPSPQPGAASRVAAISVHVTGRDLGGAATALVDSHVRAGRNAIVVVATGAEMQSVAEVLQEAYAGRVLRATSGLEDRVTTAAWTAMQSSRGMILVGTREIALWPFPGLGVAVVIDDGRPAMKAKQTPTLHVRDVLRRRAGVERFELAIVGAVPSAEAIAMASRIIETPGRAWPFVELADRREQPPGAGVLTDTAKAAVSAVAGRGGRVFVLAPRRGFAAAQACVACGAMRRCPECGGSAESEGPCPRCGADVPGPCAECGSARYRPIGAGIGRIREELERLVGPLGDRIGVGTERDLVGVSGQDLALAVDLDGRMLSPNYRAGETALRVGARLALTLGHGSGRRAIVQTSLPDHGVMRSLVSGNPLPYLRDELARRESLGLPPAGEVLAVEIRGEHPDRVDDELRRACEGATVRGPAAGDGAARWLVQGRDLHRTRTLLRPAVQQWRDAGLTVRVDVDPVDL